MPVCWAIASSMSAAAIARAMRRSSRPSWSGAASAQAASALGLPGQRPCQCGGVGEQVSDLPGVEGVQRDAPGRRAVRR